MTEPTLFSPTLYGWRRIRSGLYRWNCGRRFGHFILAGEISCGRCGRSLL